MKRTDPSTLGARRAYARRLLKRGVAQDPVVKQVRRKFGRGISMGWLVAERRLLRAEKAGTALRVDEEAAKTLEAPVLPPATSGRITTTLIEREPLIQLAVEGEVLELAKPDAHRVAVALLALLGYDEHSNVWKYPKGE